MIDYVMIAMLVNVIIVLINTVNILLIKSKLKKQERLMEYVYARAVKAKKLEQHREHLEEQRLAKIKKPRAASKK